MKVPGLKDINSKDVYLGDRVRFDLMEANSVFVAGYVPPKKMTGRIGYSCTSFSFRIEDISDDRWDCIYFGSFDKIEKLEIVVEECSITAIKKHKDIKG